MKLLTLSFLVCHAVAIWPAPQYYSHGSSVVWIADDVDVTYNGQSVRWSPGIPYSKLFGNAWKSETENFMRAQVHFGLDHLSLPDSDSFDDQTVVQYAVKRMALIIFNENFIPWKLVPRNELGQYEPAPHDQKTYIKTIVMTQSGVDTASSFKPLAGQVDESYNLTVGADGTANIDAISHQGILRALETFTQLFYSQSQTKDVYSNLAPVQIIDKPMFPHRGLNLDVSRNYYPVADILRTIDALAYNKFNRLHIHMTDSQSWPLDIPALPELSQKGAYQTGLSYNPADFAEIQIYAVYRGVEVYIEMDMPGHTTAIGLAYPDLITAFDAQPWDTYCAEPPCGSLKLNSPAVSNFLETLFADVLPRVSPYSSYFHTGGDEVNAQAYTLDDTVMSNDTAVLQPLMQKFVDRNHAQVRAAGLAPVVWEEMALQWNLTLGSDVVVQTWISDSSLSEVTALGHKALFGNYNFWVSFSVSLYARPRSNVISISIVAKDNGWTFQTAHHSTHSTHSTITAHRSRTGD
jgi:hexosaminidase